MEEDYNVDEFVVSTVDEQEGKQDDNVQLSNEDNNGRTDEDNSESVSDESTVSGVEERSDNSIRGDTEAQTSTESDSAETERLSEEDDKFLNSLRKLLSENNDQHSEEVSDEVSGGQTNDDLLEEPEEVEESVIDYSATLNSILDELEEVNSNYESLQTYLEDTNDNNSMNSTLSTQSATNVLLCIAIIVALIDLVYHFAKGVL